MTVINAVPVTEVFIRHGVEVRQGKCCCPFHADDTPSLSIYGNGQRWKCFGCGKGGNVIDAMMYFEDLTFIEALKRFDEDYKLRLFADGDETVPVRRRTSVYTYVAELNKQYKQIRQDALEGYYFYNAILRCYKAPIFKSKAEEKTFWETVGLREACERTYEALSDIKI